MRILQNGEATIDGRFTVFIRPGITCLWMLPADKRKR